MQLAGIYRRMMPSTEVLSSKVHKVIQLLLFTNRKGIFISSYFEKGCRKKVHATILKGIVGDFKCTVFQGNLKESYGRPLIYVCECWRKVTKVGSTATVVRNSVLIVSHITFRDCRVHFILDKLSRNSCIYINSVRRRILIMEQNSSEADSSVGTTWKRMIRLNLYLHGNVDVFLTTFPHESDWFLSLQDFLECLFQDGACNDLYLD